MKNIRVKSLTLGILLLLLSSCSEIFEEPIDDKQVNLLAPGDNAKSSNYSQTFWWDPVEDALLYNIQIVSPDFNNITSLVVDTVISSSKFFYTMDPGTYQWRVRAMNGSSETPYAVRNLTIDTTSIVSQTVNLMSPATGIFDNAGSIQFKWYPLFGATKYTIQIDTITGDFSSPLVDAIATSSSYSYAFKKEGKFQWKVSAANATETSLFSSVRNLTIDKTAPQQVVLTSPSSEFSYPKPIVLKWNASSSSDISKYRVYAYSVGISDTTLLSSYPKTITSGETFSFNEGSAGQKIVWRVTAIDFAENESVFSSFRNFKISP